MDYENLKANDGTGPAVLAHVTSPRAIAATTLEVDSVDNWPDKFICTTGVILASGFLDPETITEFTGHLNAGDIEIDDFEPGFSDIGNTTSDVAIIKPAGGFANRVVELAQVAHNDDGTLKEDAVRDALELGTAEVLGWEAFPHVLSVASGFNAGNKSFVLDSSDDPRDFVSPGMKMRIQRGTAAPTQMADLASASSHYARLASGSITGFAGVTDDITIEATIETKTYTGDSQSIFARRTASTAGFEFSVAANGTLTLACILSSGNRKDRTSYCSVPLGEKVHVAASMDMSGNTGAIYINGKEVPSYQTTTGTANAFTQAGNLDLGAYNSASAAGHLANMKIQEVRMWSVVRTPTQIADNMSKPLVGNETNLLAYYPLNGSFNDLTANANHLTGQNGATANHTDNAWNDTEYFFVTKVTATQITGFTGSDYSIPDMTLTAPFFSTQGNPFGWPSDNKWTSRAYFMAGETTNVGGLSTYVAVTGVNTVFPVGAWEIGYKGTIRQGNSSAGSIDFYMTLSTSSTAETIRELTLHPHLGSASVTGAGLFPAHTKHRINLDTATQFWLIGQAISGGGTITVGYEVYIELFAKCAYAS